MEFSYSLDLDNSGPVRCKIVGQEAIFAEN